MLGLGIPSPIHEVDESPFQLLCDLSHRQSTVDVGHDRGGLKGIWNSAPCSRVRVYILTMFVDRTALAPLQPVSMHAEGLVSLYMYHTALPSYF